MRVYYRCPVHEHFLETAYCPRCPLKYAAHDHDFTGRPKNQRKNTVMCVLCWLEKTRCEDDAWPASQIYHLQRAASEPL